MRHPILLASLVGLLLVGLATPALAGEWIDGDGYRFRLPEGFRAANANSLPGGLSMNVNGGPLGDDVELEVKAFARNPNAPADGMLVVMRMLATGELGRQLRDNMSIDKLEAQFEHNADAAARMLGNRGIELDELSTKTLGASHRALVMSLVQDQPGFGEVRVRMAITTYEESVYVFTLVGATSNDTQDAVAWNTLTTSIQLSSPNKLMRLLKKNWMFVLGGVVVLAFLILSLRGRSSGGARRPRYSTTRAAGTGFSRAMDGLPTYDEGPGAGGPHGPHGAHAGGGPARIPTSAPAPELPLVRPEPTAPVRPPRPAPAAPLSRDRLRRTIPLSKVEDSARGVVAEREAREQRERAQAAPDPSHGAEANPLIQGNWPV